MIFCSQICSDFHTWIIISPLTLSISEGQWWLPLFSYNSHKINSIFLCYLFPFSNQLISKQHLVRIINEYTVWEALKNSNWFWSFWLRYATDYFVFGYALVPLTMGYFRFPLGWVPFSSACFFQRLLMI